MDEEQLKIIKDLPDIFSKESVTSVKAKNESEKFLMDFELESRRSEELDAKIKAAKNELFLTKKFLKDTLGWEPSGKNSSKLENLEKQLNNIRVQYGKVRKENENLREHIQIIRRNATGAHRELTNLSSNLQKVQTKTKEFQNFYKSNQEITLAQKARMEKLNASFTSERVILTDKASKLEEIYKKEAHSVTPTSVKRPRTPYSELEENMKALNFINTKWTNRVKEKEKEISEYRENIKGLEEALEVMKNIVNTNDYTIAVKSFIDSCDYEKDLSTSFLKLSEKIENIERNIKKTKNAIQKVSEDSQNKELEKQNIFNKIEKELSKIKAQEERLNKNKEEKEKIIENASPMILKMISGLEGIGLSALSFQLIEDPSLNSTNVLSHLNKLEELIDLFLVGLKMRSPQNFEAKEEKNEKSIILNAIDIDDVPTDEINYPMTVEEIRTQALNLLNASPK